MLLLLLLLLLLSFDLACRYCCSQPPTLPPGCRTMLSNPCSQLHRALQLISLLPSPASISSLYPARQSSLACKIFRLPKKGNMH